MLCSLIGILCFLERNHMKFLINSSTLNLLYHEVLWNIFVDVISFQVGQLLFLILFKL